MSLAHLIRYARTLSLGSVAAKGLSTTRRIVCARWRACINANRSTYPVASIGLSLAKAPPGFTPRFLSFLRSRRSVLLGLAHKYFAHEFDLLGSGWVRVAHGVSCQGFMKNLYPPSAKLVSLTELTKRLSPGNRETSSFIRALITKAYTPIDWQLSLSAPARSTTLDQADQSQ